MSGRRRHGRGRGDRRGAALAGAVLVMTVVNLAVISAVVAGSGDGLVVSWRVHGLRATLAAESGAFMARGEIGAGRTLEAGVIELPGGETVRIGAVEDGQVTVEGVVQESRRSLEVVVEAGD